MIRRPPRSTLFPYTRSSDLVSWIPKRSSAQRAAEHGSALQKSGHALQFFVQRATKHLVTGQRLAGIRSEEHTSELQSQSNLVCRLLLEKKKKNKMKQ